MRRSFWCWLACFALYCGAAHAEVQELREARALITVDGVSVPDKVHLPYHWDRMHPGKAGTASFEIAFAMPSLRLLCRLRLPRHRRFRRPVMRCISPGSAMPMRYG